METCIYTIKSEREEKREKEWEFKRRETTAIGIMIRGQTKTCTHTMYIYCHTSLKPYYCFCELRIVISGRHRSHTKRIHTQIPKQMPDSFRVAHNVSWWCTQTWITAITDSVRMFLIINTVCGVVQGDRRTQRVNEHWNNIHKNNGLMSLFFFSFIGMTRTYTISLICDSSVTVFVSSHAADLSSMRKTCCRAMPIETEKAKIKRTADFRLRIEKGLFIYFHTFSHVHPDFMA